MMHNLSKISEKSERPFLFNCSLSLGLAAIDKKDFTNYKTNSLVDVSEERMQEMRILSVLEKLGFPIQEVGTYLYKDMIVKAMKELDGYDVFGNPVTHEELLQKMKSPYSQFYMDVARNEWDIGIKSFHAYIEHALENVCYDEADATLLLDIYSNFSSETDYGEHAFIIARYMKKTLQAEAGTQYYKRAVIPATSGIIDS